MGGAEGGADEEELPLGDEARGGEAEGEEAMEAAEEGGGIVVAAGGRMGGRRAAGGAVFSGGQRHLSCGRLPGILRQQPA